MRTSDSHTRNQGSRQSDELIKQSPPEPRPERHHPPQEIRKTPAPPVGKPGFLVNVLTDTEATDYAVVQQVANHLQVSCETVSSGGWPYRRSSRRKAEIIADYAEKFLMFLKEPAVMKCRLMLQFLFLISSIAGMIGCAHIHAEPDYALSNGSLTHDAEVVAHFGMPAATYHISLIHREGAPFLVRESFTNDKRVLMVELLPHRVAGRIISAHRNFMDLNASGIPTWSGIEILDSGLKVDDELWDHAFDITDSLALAEPDATARALLGTVIFVRTYDEGTAVSEHRMFSATAPEAPVDVARLGSLSRCDSSSDDGRPKSYAIATGGQGVIDIRLNFSPDGMVRGSYSDPAQGEEISLTGQRNGNTLVLRSGNGETVFEGEEKASLFIGKWLVPDRGIAEAELGCAVL